MIFIMVVVVTFIMVIVVVFITMLFISPIQRRFCITGNIVLIGIAVKPIRVKCESTGTTLNTSSPRALIRVIRTFHFQIC
jgi:hypothetical protein